MMREPIVQPQQPPAQPAKQVQPEQPALPAQTAAVARASAQLAALEGRRSELKGQLSSLTERRFQFSVQMRDAEGDAKREFQARINALDNRTARINDELNQIDDAVSAAIAGGATHPPSLFEQITQGALAPSPTPPPRFPVADIGNIASVLLAQGIGFVLISLVLWRWLRRRGPGSATSQDAGRLEQLQRAVDVIAVEVERISEGQRYVTKILNDKLPAIGAGAAQEVPIPRRDGERVKASTE
jgi:hypothetical protein